MTATFRTLLIVSYPESEATSHLRQETNKKGETVYRLVVEGPNDATLSTISLRGERLKKVIATLDADVNEGLAKLVAIRDTEVAALRTA